MFELGCHLIDSLTVFMGAPDKVAPYVRHTYPDRDNLADNIIGMFEYPRATATIRSSLMEVEGFRRRQMVAVGENGTITIRPSRRQSSKSPLQRTPETSKKVAI